MGLKAQKPRLGGSCVPAEPRVSIVVLSTICVDYPTPFDFSTLPIPGGAHPFVSRPQPVRITGQKSAWVDETVKPGSASHCNPVPVGAPLGVGRDTARGPEYPSERTAQMVSSTGSVPTIRGKGLIYG